MFVSELATQGVKGRPSTERIRFQAGLNAAQVESRARRQQFVDLWFHGLFPDSARTEATVKHAAGDPARVVLMLRGRNDSTFRLMRDLRSGAASLSRYQEATQRYERLTRAANEAAQFLRVQQRFCDENSFERLFLIQSRGLPSQEGERMPMTQALWAPNAGGGFPGSLPGPSLSGTGSIMPPMGTMPGASLSTMGMMPGSSLSTMGMFQGGTGYGPMMPNPMNALVVPDSQGLKHASGGESLEAKLKRLKQELRAQAAYEEAETSIDGLRAERESLETYVKALKTARDDVKRLKAEGEVFDKKLREIPEDMEARLDRFEDTRRQIDGELMRVGSELSQDLAPLKPSPIVRDPYFLGAVAVAVLMPVAAVASGLGWLALLNLPAVAVAAVAGFRYITELESAHKAKLKLKGLEDRRQLLQERFELDTAVTRRMLKDLNLTPATMRQLLKQQAAFRSGYQTALETLNRLEAETEKREGAKRFDALVARIQELEHRLNSAEPGLMSAASLQAEIDEVEREMAEEARNGRSEGSVDGTDPQVEAETVTRNAAPVVPPEAPGAEEDASFLMGSGPPLGYAPASESMPYGYGGMPVLRDRTEPMVQAALDLLQIEVDGLVAEHQARMERHLCGFSQGRFTELVFAASGRVSVIGEAGETPVAELRGKDADHVDLALRIGLVEAIQKTVELPLLVEDPLGPDDSALRPLLFQSLALLAKHNQVILLTPAAIPAGAHPIAV